MRSLGFQVGKYIKIKLEKEEVNLYVDNELFIQCMHILAEKKLKELDKLTSFN